MARPVRTSNISVHIYICLWLIASLITIAEV